MDRSLRILHVMLTLAPAYGGPVTTCLSYCRHLAALGHDVTVFATDLPWPPGARRDGSAPEPGASAGFAVQRFPALEPTFAISPSLWAGLAKQMAMTDVVHVHGAYRFPGLAAARVAHRHGVPYIVRPYGCLLPYGRDQRRNWLAKRVYERLFELPGLNRAAAMHYTTEDERVQTDRLGIRAPAIVVPCAIDLPADVASAPRGGARARLGYGDEPIVLFVGRIAAVKRIEVLVRALPSVLHVSPRARLVIVGPDEDGLTDGLMREAADLGVTEHIAFLGMIQGTEKLDLMRDADVFVMPSYSESFGNAVIEAMATGTPAVVSRGVALWRDVEASGGGLAVDADPVSLGAGIAALLHDAAPEAWRSRAAALASRFAGPRVASDLVAHYRALIAGRTGVSRDRSD